MTDAEFKKEKARVEAAYRKWASPTGMFGWIVSHVWYRDDTAGGGAEYAGSVARTHVSWEYQSVTFHWNLQSIARHNDEEIDRIIRHEICHVLVNEVREWGPEQLPREQANAAMKHEERAVTALAMVLRWCREEGKKDAKKREVRRGRK